MAGLKGLTINTAPEAEPHLYAEDDAAIYQAICGADGVFQIGQQCESQVISNNKVRVKDGVIIVGGHFARIPYGDYIDFEIANGQTGKKRNDILIAKFVTTGSGGIDTFTGEVKQGAAATGEATDPALTQNDLYQGGKIREMPLYRVKLDGLSITEVEPMFDLIPTIPTLNSYLLKRFQFSTSEVETQEKWIGGKRIYSMTVVTRETIPAGGDLTIPLSLSGADRLWIDQQNSYIRSDTQCFPLPVPKFSTSDDSYIGIWVNTAGIRLYSNAGWNSAWEKCVTLRYTKKTD